MCTQNSYLFNNTAKLTFGSGPLDIAVEACTRAKVVEALLFDELQNLRGDLLTKLTVKNITSSVRIYFFGVTVILTEI